MHMMQAIQKGAHGPTGIDAIPDHTLGRILGLLGKQERFVNRSARLIGGPRCLTAPLAPPAAAAVDQVHLPSLRPCPIPHSVPSTGR